MIATIEKVGIGFEALFIRQLKSSVEEVWAWLTENGKLTQWFSELRVEELRKGGYLKFDMGNGTFEEMEILDLSKYSVLEYTWGEDKVRFELSPSDSGGCTLRLIEKIKTITPHTPKDLAGWHMCLDAIEALLEGKEINREVEWKGWFEKYQDVVERVSL